MIRSTLAAVTFALLAAPATSQSCSQLMISGQGHHGTMMTFAMTGAGPNAPAMLGIAGHQGSTSYSFGHMGGLLMGLSEPILFGHMGTTGPAGGVQMSVMVPNRLMQRVQMHAQAFTVTMSAQHGGPQHGGPMSGQMGGHGSMSFCTSNVASFSCGGGGMMP